MKKLFTSLILLAVGVMATYAENYDLWVAGTRVTSSNASSIATGVKYDASSKILTLTNATITPTSSTAIESKIDGLKIRIVGSCTIGSTSTEENTLLLKNNTTIQGNDFNARLTVNGTETKTGKCAVWVREGASLTIENLWMSVISGYYCFTADGNETIKFFTSNVYMSLTKTTSTSCIDSFTSVGMGGSTYDYNGYKYDTTNKKLVTASGTVVYQHRIRGRLEINKYIIDPRSSYTLTSSSTGSGITSGSIVWNKDAKELQLKDVKMTATSSFNAISFYGFYGNTDGLYVWVDGTNNNITAYNQNGFYTYNRDLTIDGQSASAAKLTIGYTGTSAYSAINVGGSKLNIVTVDLSATSLAQAIKGNGSTELAIGESKTSGAKIIATSNGSSNNYAISGFSKCTMLGCDVKSPNYTCFRTAKKAFANASGVIASQVEIAIPSKWYEIYVLGYQLNNVNPTRFGIEGMTGTMSYNESSNTLTLDNVTLTPPSTVKEIGVKIGAVSSDVIVNLVGENSITTRDNAFQIGKNTTFSGSGEGEFTSTEESGLSGVGGACPTFTLLTPILFKGKKYGYWGTGSTNEVMTISKTTKGGYVRFSGESAAVHNLTKLTLTNVDFASNSATSENLLGCYFDANKKQVVQNGGTTAKGTVAFGYIEKSYDITVGGVPVTNCNMYGVGSPYITAGGATAVTYSSSTNTLTLNQVTLTAPSDNTEPGIKMKPSTYVSEIVLYGENRITTVGDAIRIYGDGTISGSGELYATSTSEGALSMWAANSKASLTLNCKTVKAKGKKFGFWGNSQSCTSNLILKNGNGKAWYVFNGETASVGDATDIQMPTGVKGIDFYKDNVKGTAGCYFDDRYVRQNGGSIVKGSDVICGYIDYDYGITVAGVPVTDCNKEGIGSKYITSGGATAVTYSSGTLSLNNATIDTGNANCALKYTGLSNDVTIDVTGDCEFKKPSGWTTTYLGGNTTITGSGTLTVNGELGSREGKTMTFDNVNIKAGEITSQSSKPSKLYVSLTTKGKTVSATNGIYDWGTIYLQNGTKVVEPAGARLSDDETEVVTSGGARAYNVVFGDETATGIDGIEADANAEVIGIFDAQGRQLNEMQPGLNIIRMSDGTTKKVVVK